MRAYSIFDDIPDRAVSILEDAGVEVTIHPKGMARPTGDNLKKIIVQYDIILLGTGQKISGEMLADVTSRKIIGTASIGTDHINIPENKKELVTLVNAPVANRLSVAEHTFAIALALSKQIYNGRQVAVFGGHKNKMVNKPHDLFGKTMGVIGAGGTAEAVLKMAFMFGMNCLCWTRTPEKHHDLREQGVSFCAFEEVLSRSDIISVNLPLTKETDHIISKKMIEMLKDDAIFICTSRPEIVDCKALLEKAGMTRTFSVGMDVDADKIQGLWNEEMVNVIVTPHIAGGTVESRVRLFVEVCQNICRIL